MATVKVYDQNRQESGEVTLASDVFEVEVRPEILNLVVRAQMAAKRAGTHNAKTRAFVSGGGVKPWKQKGTGRARSGSNRSPVRRRHHLRPQPARLRLQGQQQGARSGPQDGSVEPSGRRKPAGGQGH